MFSHISRFSVPSPFDASGALGYRLVIATVCQGVGSGAGSEIFLGRRGDVIGWFEGVFLARRRGARVRFTQALRLALPG
jgi:hypothetical protein